ncbi:MAG: WYL domain-containing protein, partial [Muribaculaceae bacterium]|nr:WYL domain-containing protein [Muribaculaceae bacterium]
MNAGHKALKRQMLIINRLTRAGMPVAADDIIDYLEKNVKIYDYSYPEERGSRMRLLQRDIKSISDTFKIQIGRSGKSSYEITDKDEDWIVSYERLFADFDLLTALNPDSDINRYIKPERSRNKGSELLFEILWAIKKRCVVEFDYVNYRQGGRERHHTFAPHFLKEDQGLWYMAGYESGKYFIFALDRIRNLTLTDDTFKFDESLDIEENFKDSFGIWADPDIPVEDIELRYDSVDGCFLKAKPLHPSQVIIADTADEFRIRLRLRITNDFVMALLSRARSLEVISPAHLRERVRDTFREAYERNS